MALRCAFDKLRAGSEGQLFHGVAYISEFFPTPQKEYAIP
jgi:hypothetical protein